jgi:hypothetical protein
MWNSKTLKAQNLIGFKAYFEACILSLNRYIFWKFYKIYIYSNPNVI